MGLLFLLRDLFFRAMSRKKTFAALAALFLLFIVLGMIFYSALPIRRQLNIMCARFMERIVYSDKNIFLIFLERTAANAALSVLILCAGVHPAALVFPPLLLAYRASVFGGTFVAFFAIYRLPGAFVVLLLYLPIHLLTDALLLTTAAISFARAKGFCFCRRDLRGLLYDILSVLAISAAICLAETMLLAVIFRPLGNIL